MRRDTTTQTMPVQIRAGTALVFATGMHTAFGRIAHLAQTTIDIASPLQKEMPP